MVGQSVWTPGVKTVWYIPGVKTVWYVHACFICSCFHSPLLTSERSKLVLQLKAENLPLSSWWLWHQQLNIYRSKNNVSVDKRGGPAAGSRCDLSFILPHLAGKTRGFNNKRGLFFFFFFFAPWNVEQAWDAWKELCDVLGGQAGGCKRRGQMWKTNMHAYLSTSNQDAAFILGSAREGEDEWEERNLQLRWDEPEEDILQTDLITFQQPRF